MKTLRLLVAAFLALLAPAAAQADVTWGGTAEARLGYGTNPFLFENTNTGSGLIGFTLAPQVDWRQPTSNTVLSGSYNRDQYFSRYGHADDYGVDLRRTQQFSAKLTGTAHAGYFSSISGLLSPFYNNIVTQPGTIDSLAVGTRQQRIYGDVGLDYQPNARDAFSVTGVAEHDSYSRFFGGNYTYVGGTGSYSRAIDARTRVGFQLVGGESFSKVYPDTASIQPAATLQRKLSAHWTFKGSLGAIIELQRIGGRSRTNVTLGFSASLCNDRPRLSLCATASRQTAPSGLGGLRRETQFGVEGTYRLSERSRVIGSAVYGLSDTDQLVVVNQIAYGNQRYAFARLSYQRDLSRRLSAGASGYYQQRSGGGLPNIHALAITFNLTAKFGHLPS
jgi:hypothetical protein